MEELGIVYVLKLDAPLGNSRHRAQFYVGWAVNLDRRLKHHRNGTGAAFTAAAAERGIGMQVVWSAPGTRALEREIKRWKNTRAWLKARGVRV